MRMPDTARCDIMKSVCISKSKPWQVPCTITKKAMRERRLHDLIQTVMNSDIHQQHQRGKTLDQDTKVFSVCVDIHDNVYNGVMWGQSV